MNEENNWSKESARYWFSQGFHNGQVYDEEEHLDFDLDKLFENLWRDRKK